jgi:hypothetical protein
MNAASTITLPTAAYTSSLSTVLILTVRMPFGIPISSSSRFRLLVSAREDIEVAHQIRPAPAIT